MAVLVVCDSLRADLVDRESAYEKIKGRAAGSPQAAPGGNGNGGASAATPQMPTGITLPGTHDSKIRPTKRRGRRLLSTLRRRPIFGVQPSRTLPQR